MGKIRNHRATKMIDRTLFAVGWAVVLATAVQALPLTRLVYSPQKVVISGDQVTLYRGFPWDSLFDWRPRMSYVERVRPLTQSHNNGHFCEDSRDPFRYVRAEQVGKWAIDWAADCLSDPTGFEWTATWYWHIGAFAVGPASLSTTVFRDPCQYKISSSGIVHGPDSPHWAVTSEDRCFATKAAAEIAATE